MFVTDWTVEMYGDFALLLSKCPNVYSADVPSAMQVTGFNLHSLKSISSVVRAFAHGAMCRRIDPPWCGPIELFLVPASAPRLV